MRQHRVYIPDLRQGSLELFGEEAHHLIKVLRVKPGMRLEAFNGQGLYAAAEVKEVDRHQLSLEVFLLKETELESSVKVTLAVALLKGDKLADVVRQATELGVHKIQLFSSQFADVPELSQNKLERLRKITIEAAKQSGRSFIPDVLEPVPLKNLTLTKPCLIAHPYATQTLKNILIEKEVMIITGPEGGVSEDELSYLEKQGAEVIKFGPRILRAETAPTALLAALLLPQAL